jgi:hypothetical protein
MRCPVFKFKFLPPAPAPAPRNHVTVFHRCTASLQYCTVAVPGNRLVDIWGTLHAKVIRHIGVTGVSDFPCCKGNLKTADPDIAMIPLRFRAMVISYSISVVPGIYVRPGGNVEMLGGLRTPSIGTEIV